MSVNKVVRKTANGAETLIDLTSDSVTPATLAEGVTAHDKSGNAITGTMPVNGAISKTLDTSTTSYTVPKGYTDGGTVKIVTETKTVTPTKSTQNITPSSGKVLSKVTVNPIPDTYVDASTVATNTKNYEITLTKSSGWVLLTALDDDVIEHINDASLVVSLVRISPYTYERYIGSTFICSNTPWGYNGSYPSYGFAGTISSETACQANHIYYPPNNTGTSTALGGRGAFRISGKNYYVNHISYYVATGTYRLTFTW